MEDNRPYKIPWPKGLVEYIREHCAREHYLFFSNKLGKAKCSHCGTEFDLCELPYLKHEPDNGRLTTYCPECGATVTPKDMRYGRKRLQDCGRITWTRGYGSVTFIETDVFIIDYETPFPSVLLTPDMQIRLDGKRQERFDWQYGWFYGYLSEGCWQSIKTIRLKKQPSACWGYSKYHDHLYVPEDGKMNVGTGLQYANLDPERFDMGYFDEEMLVSRYIRYMSDFVKYPAIEVLEKSGFSKIVMGRASGSRSKYLNLRAKDLRKILKVDGADVKRLRKKNPSIGFMEDLHNVRRSAPWAQIEDVDEIVNLMGRYIGENRLQLINQYTDISKLIRKILEENRATGDLFTLGDYGDYLEAVIRLGRRTDKRTLYPRNFQQEHDQAVDEAEEKKTTIDAANFIRFQEEITGMTGPFMMDGLLIRPARTPQELRKESRELNHCVRTYVDRVARGSTSILFIRKQDEPDVPYYTLELNREGEVVQCRGDHNKDYPKEVGTFIGEWMKWRSKEMKARATA